MNSPVPPLLKPRRRYGRWVLLGLVILVTPLVIVGIGVASLLTLNRDAAVLRREVMAATNTEWSTKVQMSVGGFTLGAVRAGLHFVEAEHMDEARLALQAVRGASVGVYECQGGVGDLSLEQLFARTDKKMNARGWTRLVGVAEHDKSVLIYASDGSGSGNRLDLCLAVVEGDKLIVVSTNVDANSLAELVQKHAPDGELRGKLKLAHLRI